ncbi:MAG: aminotransferase class I/II-fold pyridoxal phosphate-dependent enzyme [Alphaproteobacteria bacterium]|nr:aminotransferase class I/II-fold pyridoxal phosphate-dependent enzyme [Alphaproteobacteria bacterium]
MRRPATELVHTPGESVQGAVVPPVHRSANYLQEDVGTYASVRYQRLSNTPQHLAIGQKLARIEHTDSALTFASGMAAISTALLALLSAGDHLIVQRNLYGGTATFLRDLARWGIESTAVDGADPSTWDAARRPTTRLFYLESISNPLLEVPELATAARWAHQHGLVAAIDNTFLSPVQYRPAEDGFDLVLHSATKYLGGHSDLVAGVVAGRADLVERIHHQQNHLGGSLDPQALFLLDRGLKTLHLRVPAQAATALRLARVLEDHPMVSRVRYPGLPSDPAHSRAARFDGCGGMLAFELATPEAARRFVDRVRIPLHAASLGSVESLVVLPARSSHLGLTPEERAAIGISDSLVRMSVGVEDPDDLEEDVLRALA